MRRPKNQLESNKNGRKYQNPVFFVEMAEEEDRGPRETEASREE